MPGFKKDEISIELKDGYLSVSAKKEQTHSEGDDKKGNYIRRERMFAASRSYYVGDKVVEQDIKAKYENGVLSIVVPKEEPKKLPEHKISID
jgi:HSP20 family molecular chaperone IbpA